MAQVTNHRTSRAAQLRHWIYPSHRQVILLAAVEAAFTRLGLPLWAHILAAVAVHWIIVRR
jgi:hypothetical protein